MFTYIKLKNFLSFGEVTFNFKRNAKTAKRFVAIYGENGSGKSNFVKSIDLLCRSLVSFDRGKRNEELSDWLKNVTSSDNTPIELLQKIIDDSDIRNYLSSFRMKDCPEPTEVEYGFLLNGHEGRYKFTFTDKFTQESLYCFTGKQRGYLYDISSNPDGKILNKFYPELFKSSNEQKETLNDLEKYWGKHTLLGLVVHKLQERNPHYNRENISKYLLDVISLFFDTTVIMKGSKHQTIGVVGSQPDKILRNLASGKIPKQLLPQLECSERILQDFFTQAYADIKDVFYEKEYTGNNMIRYQLYVDKMIAGKVRRISFDDESTGTQQVLEIARMLLGLFCGITVVFDEIDTGIHDVLLNSIISSLTNEISGQLIITTHNTMLLEEIDPHSAYLIQVDYQGNKNVKCLAEFPIKSNNNARRQYLKGMFGGTPYIDGIDYTSIMAEIAKVKENQ